jgi:hypothetical protein
MGLPNKYQKICDKTLNNQAIDYEKKLQVIPL